MLLVGVVAIGVLGRMSPEPTATPLVSGTPSLEPVVAAAPTPSHRSDWPAAIGRRRDIVNRFTIDDVVTAGFSLDPPPLWVRRNGGMTSYETDPAAG